MKFYQNEITELKRDSFKNIFILIIYSLIPIFLIVGTAISEIAIITLSLIFIFEFLTKKQKLFHDNIIYFLILLYISLIINLAFSENFYNSLIRNIFFLNIFFLF